MHSPYFSHRSFRPILTESEFLINLAVEQYNRQHHQKMTIDEFEITSIRPRVGHALAYEIQTKRKDDYLKFRIYLNIGTINRLHPYLPEVDQGYSPPLTLEDEYLVAFGTVDGWYRQEGIYHFRPINNEELLKEYLALEDGRALLLENGEVFEL